MYEIYALMLASATIGLLVYLSKYDSKYHCKDKI